ncbi:MAG TPA: ABC transporter ATP-binding protein [Candidatus Limiplasma sp.]|nr:ABC transporter ATP-binding protein [Candidatus Limiplasma sp.]HPS81612.1 ABC transporter ATP-binding protein [Candidatus Limiplasma sp.]
MDVLSVQGLGKAYENFKLQDIRFTVQPGEIMGFIGRNGAGKTTTLKALLNFVHPDTGDIRFFGLPFAENELAIKRRIGFVSGGVDYYTRKKLRVITSVSRSFYPNWDEAAYRNYLTLFHLDENKTPSQLSAGMKVKYNLALALSHRAELLILDEPTSGLDPVSRDDLLDVFLLLAKGGASILFSTHITSDLDRCADRITYIHNGRLLASENLEAFTSKYRALEFPEERLTSSMREKLIGLKPSKHGYTAIAIAKEAEAFGVETKPADLETIMIHLEKE